MFRVRDVDQQWLSLGKLFEYHRNARKSRAELEALQLAKFRRLVAHANRRSPYYAQLIRREGIDPDRCTPQHFPELTKTTLLERFDDIVTDRRVTLQAVIAFLERSADPADLFLDRFHVVHTSGSSGEVGYFVFSRADWVRGITQVARFRPPRLGFRRQKTAFVGATGGHFAGNSSTLSGQRGLNALFYRVRCFEVNMPIETIVAELNAYAPDHLVGYASTLKALAGEQRAGRLRIAPRRVDTSGEVATDEDRLAMSEVFGTPVHDLYATSEHLMMGLRGPDDPGMMLFEDDLIFELCNEHTVVTNLFNFTMPLIRYRMADFLRPASGATRGPYRTLEGLVTRSEIAPVFVNREGRTDFISAISICGMLVPDASRFQFQLIDPTSFRFAICPDPSLDGTGREALTALVSRQLEAILAHKLMENVRFEVVYVDELSVDPKTRKFRLVTPPP